MPPALVPRNQPRLHQRLLWILSPQMPKQQVPAARRITNSETRNRIPIQSAIFQIRARCLSFERSLQLFHKECLRLAMNLHQYRALLIFSPLLR